MRRILIGVTVSSIALAAAIVLSRPEPPPNHVPFRIRLEAMHARALAEAELRRLLPTEEVYRRPEISAMDCRIVAKERLDGDRFLLTEECAWKGGRVERRRFTALRKGDGPSQGWMYRLAESDT